VRGSSSRIATHGSDRALPRPLVPKETLILAGPGPGVDHPRDRRAGHRRAEAKILASGLSVSQLVSTAWGVGSTFAAPTNAVARMARVFVSRRRRTGRSTSRPTFKTVLQKLEAIQNEFGKKVCACRPDRARRLRSGRKSRKGRRIDCEGSLTPGRMDASAGSNRVESSPRSNRVPTASATMSRARSFSS